jgi:flagellar basal body-associated protein FliL
MNPENTQATAETKSGSMKAIIAIIVIAAIAGGAYYFLAGKAASKTESPADQTPALSASDDVASIKADLGSTTVTDADLSSFDAELNAK